MGKVDPPAELEQKQADLEVAAFSEARAPSRRRPTFSSLLRRLLEGRQKRHGPSPYAAPLTKRIWRPTWPAMSSRKAPAREALATYDARAASAAPSGRRWQRGGPLPSELLSNRCP